MWGKCNDKDTILFFFTLLAIAAFCNSFPLSTNSRWIFDEATGRRVKLACANWASHLQPMIAEGLEKKNVKDIVRQIVSTKFNCVRFTWPTFMFTRAYYGNLTVAQSLDKLGLTLTKAGIARNNPQFMDMVVASVHQVVVNEITAAGLMVVLDNHVTEPGWCCSSGGGEGFFGDPSFDPEEWLFGFSNVAKIYSNNPAVVGIGLRNAPKGNGPNKDEWYRYMQEAATIIHALNPNVLVIVSHLPFLESRPFKVDIGNKLVFEASWFTFGTPDSTWKAQTNVACARMILNVVPSFLSVILGNVSYPLFLSEFGMDQTGQNEADNRYMSCLLSIVVSYDLDWGFWAFQGSYMLREGKVNTGEEYGIMGYVWDRPRNPQFLSRLNAAALMNQELNPQLPIYFKIYHPQSGKCVVVGKQGLFLNNCDKASRWEQHPNGDPIKLVDKPLCLTVVGEGLPAQVSNDCSSNRSKWFSGSSAHLQLAAESPTDEPLCLQKYWHGASVITMKCLCVNYPKLDDVATCADNPQSQWFTFVPSNIV